MRIARRSFLLGTGAALIAPRGEERIESATPHIRRHANTIVREQDFDVTDPGFPHLDLDGTARSVREGVSHRIQQQVGQHLPIWTGIAVHRQVRSAVDRKGQLLLAQPRLQAHHHLLGEIGEIEHALV